MRIATKRFIRFEVNTDVKETNNMSYKPIDEGKLAEMYSNPSTTVKTIQNHFDISSGVVYRHLKSQGIESNRKTSIPWTEKENAQLIAGREEGLTGQELYDVIPTRKPMAIKSRVQKLRRDKVIR